MALSTNAAVAIAEIDRDHVTAAQVSRKMLNTCQNEVSRRDEARREAFMAAHKRGGGQLAEQAEHFNLSERYNFRLLESNTHALESSILLLSVSFDQDQFLEAVKSNVDPTEVQSSPSSRQAKAVKPRTSGNFQQAKKAPLGVCKAPCDIPCGGDDEVAEDPLKSMDGGDFVIGNQMSDMREEDEDELLKDGLIPAMPEEAEIVRRWLCGTTIPTEKDSKHPKGYPIKFNWFDHAEVFSPALSHKHIKRAAVANTEERPSNLPRKGLSMMKVAAKFLTTKTKEQELFEEVPHKEGRKAQRVWLLACLCRHPPGQVPSLGHAVGNVQWRQHVADAMMEQDEKKSSEDHEESAAPATERPHDHLPRHHPHHHAPQHNHPKHNKVSLGCRRHLFQTQENLDMLVSHMDVSNGEINNQLACADGILIPGDKLMMEGPLTGCDVRDVPRLVTPVKLIFKLKKPKLRAHAIVPVTSGPFVEVHENFWNFRGTFLHPGPRFKNIIQIYQFLEELNDAGLWQGRTKMKPVDDEGSKASAPRAIPLLSARRHPQHAMNRGVK
eukprot:gnl/MRDRNA2_/MRDRNA2_32417_c0_seq1.p1 gnl/MRDRNA2_/MRDRNA2_32417_c0~~gnl/MRDRNA2_/MRDRNA2_32417_c0_seq1.p1  ORF type:complete len:598 (+),score=108.13 gnl/MRDRNA2_/MRDRNA2_32417_c0_seq1:138-1796(+)